MANKTSLKDDIKTMWVGGCKELVGWLSSFGQPKVNKALEDAGHKISIGFGGGMGNLKINNHLFILQHYSF